MGYYSWQTADWQQSINHTGSDEPHDSPVYLLQPDGMPIKEEAYDGLGHFGHVDAYLWLSARNMPEQVSDLIKDMAPDVTENEVKAMIDFFAGREGFDAWDVDSVYIKAQSNNIDRAEVVFKIRDLSITEFSEQAMFDPNTGERILKGVNGISSHGDEPVVRYEGKSLNELKQQGFFEIKAVTPEFPLKFSFNKDADYHSLPASEDCPEQGFSMSLSPY